MTKITGMPEETSVDPADLFTFVDVSDTSVAATGRNKRVTAANLRLGSFAFVEHGSTAGTARPAASVVYWVGSVAPTNAVAHDLWYNTTA